MKGTVFLPIPEPGALRFCCRADGVGRIVRRLPVRADGIRRNIIDPTGDAPGYHTFYLQPFEVRANKFW